MQNLPGKWTLRAQEVMCPQQTLTLAGTSNSLTLQHNAVIDKVHN